MLEVSKKGSEKGSRINREPVSVLLFWCFFCKGKGVTHIASPIRGSEKGSFLFSDPDQVNTPRGSVARVDEIKIRSEAILRGLPVVTT